MTAFAHNTELKISIAAGGLGAAMLLPQVGAALKQVDYAYGATPVIATVLGSFAGAFLLVLAVNVEWRPARWLAIAATLVPPLLFARGSFACAVRVEADALRLAALLLAALPVVIWLLALGRWLVKES